ncbi:hypothetical protein FA15DRAFT_674378, partial [Coprinopsis marcescibilis]
MDNASTPGGDPPKFNNLFCWEPIWFKVEDELFCVPRSGFTAASDLVFTDAFQLPSGTAELEAGRDKSHPIDLPDLKKVDFESLLKVMYPIPSMFIAKEGIKLDLKKEEWMSVLKLTTIWKMDKLRNHAIECLSKTDLAMSAMEKLQLAKEYRVGGWFKEGIKALVQKSPLEVDDLGALVGWDCAAHIFAIREHDAKRPHHCAEGNGVQWLRFQTIRCASCKTTEPLYKTTSQNCRYCGIGSAITDLTFTYGGGTPGSELVLGWSSIICVRDQCRQYALHNANVVCTSCKVNASSTGQIRVYIEPTVDMLIEKYFGDEIKQY